MTNLIIRTPKVFQLLKTLLKKTSSFDIEGEGK